MDYQRFYQQLYAPLAATHGPVDRDTLMALVGFDEGGPLNFCTIGRDTRAPVITYVSCELAVREAQVPNATGRYELLASCEQEDWVRGILSNIGRMTLETAFNDGDTMDIGSWVNEGWFKPRPVIRGVLFKTEATARVDGNRYGILRCIGITRSEMEYAQSQGTPALIALLRQGGVYPHTVLDRKAVV